MLSGDKNLQVSDATGLYSSNADGLITDHSNKFVQNKFKKLAIISDCTHMLDEQGNIVTETHIFCRQIEALAEHFEHTVICCPFDNFKNTSVATAYSNKRIEFIPLPKVGGNSLKDKWQIIKTIPRWLKAFKKASKQTDIVYLRMPNNLSIPGFFYFYLSRTKTFSTYTGNWENYKSEPFSFRFQKWILKNLFRGPVWIYTEEQAERNNLLKGFSPSYTEEEWKQEHEQIENRKQRYSATKITTPIFITVGSFVPHKNQQYILEVCKRLREKNFCFRWYFVGDGPLRSSFQQFINENQLQDFVCIAGKKTYNELRELYRRSDFLVQAALVEPFGKTPVEALFHGVIPVLNEVAMSNEMTGNGSRGYTFVADDPVNLEQLIYKMMDEQNKLPGMIENGRKYVKEQTLEIWASGYASTLNSFFKL